MQGLGRIIDQMAERGIISGYQGSKPREILMTKERWEELNNTPEEESISSTSLSNDNYTEE